MEHEVSAEIVVGGGAESFALDAAAIGIALEEVEGELAQGVESGRSMVAPNAAVVLPERDVQPSVQLVLDDPVAAHRAAYGLGRGPSHSKSLLLLPGQSPAAAPEHCSEPLGLSSNQSVRRVSRVWLPQGLPACWRSLPSAALNVEIGKSQGRGAGVRSELSRHRIEAL